MAPKKLNIKERFTDGEIDLSMSDLDVVPVKEIATFKKAYALDLSNNRLQNLPPTFATLTHLTKLDLSKNELAELPENFGELSKLKSLDLYHNQLQHLPLSFNKLKDLRWLDLKDNPLVAPLAKVAGPCLDTKQCQVCAKDVVNFFVQLQKQVNTELEVRNKTRQKQLELNQQKKQEEKRSKKKEKKQKQVEKPAELAPVAVIGRDVKNSTKNKRKIKPVSSCSFWKHLFMSFCISCCILFVLTSIKVKHTEDVVVFTKFFYDKFVGFLPGDWRIYGLQAGDFVGEMHGKTGNLTMEVVSYIRGQDWRSLWEPVGKFFGNLVDKLKENLGYL